MIQQLASIADSKASMPLIKSIPLSSIQSIGQSLSPLNIHQQKLRVTLQQNYAPLRTPQRPHAQLHHSESLDKWETLLDDLEKKSIQSFLQETRIQLSHYFSSLNDAKNIHTAEFHPYFITKPIDYAQIKAAA